MPAMARLDWLNKASGAAGWLVAPSIPLPPAPLVAVSVPMSSKSPFVPIGTATTALALSLVIK